MSKPDVIVTAPYCLDYPLWREEMEKNRHLFGDIYLMMYRDSRPLDFHAFVQQQTPWAKTVLMGQIGVGDWRNVCVTEALSRSSAERVLFLEQDFVALDDTFWPRFMKEAASNDVMGFSDVTRQEFTSEKGSWQFGARLHPACLLVTRDLINKTRRDFSAYPNPPVDRDHFGVFTDELHVLYKEGKVRFLPLEKYQDSWKHWAGVSWNYMLAMDGKPPVYKTDEFREYVTRAMNAKVLQDERFISLSKDALRLLDTL